MLLSQSGPQRRHSFLHGTAPPSLTLIFSVSLLRGGGSNPSTFHTSRGSSLREYSYEYPSSTTLLFSAHNGPDTLIRSLHINASKALDVLFVDSYLRDGATNQRLLELHHTLPAPEEAIGGEVNRADTKAELWEASLIGVSGGNVVREGALLFRHVRVPSEW